MINSHTGLTKTITGERKFMYCSLFCSITENVPANNSLWILGDILMTEAGGHYEKLKRKFREEKNDTADNRLYIDRHYAVKLFTPGLYTGNNVPLVVLDSLVEALNHNAKVPHTIVLAMNDRNFWNDKHILKQMAWILRKFFKELHKILDLRKYALDDNAVNWDYPRLLVTQPLPLPCNLPTEHYPKGFRSNRRKFNKLLDKAIEHGKYSIVNLASFTSQNKDSLFDEEGNISEKGYEQFWIKISNAVQNNDTQMRIIANKIKPKKLAQDMENELLLSDESDTENFDPSKKEGRDHSHLDKPKKETKPKACKSLKNSFDEASLTERNQHVDWQYLASPLQTNMQPRFIAPDFMGYKP